MANNPTPAYAGPMLPLATLNTLGGYIDKYPGDMLSTVGFNDVQVPSATSRFSTYRGQGDLLYVPIDQIKTQKARGIKAILDKGQFNLPGLYAPEGVVLIYPQGLKYIENTKVRLKDHYKPWFARPCPVTPRHGFVESRPIRNLDEVPLLLAEARSADPEAELIVMDKLSGEYSAVATAAGVAWGLGNDGVTGGKKTYFIPTPSTKVAAWKKFFRIEYFAPGYVDTTYPYIELVENKKRIVMVQYRDGPEQPTTQDYIPKAIKVTSIHYPQDWPSLLAWEFKVKELAEREGAVVHMPLGSLSSHYAVHAIAMGVPVLTRDSVSTGETLFPPLNKRPDLVPNDYHRLAARMEKWLNHTPEKNNYSAYLTTAIATLHGQGEWGADDHLLSLRAFAFPMLLKFTAASALGELRHWWAEGPGREDVRMGTTLPFKIEGQGRTGVYSRVMKEHSLRYYKDILLSAEEDFNTPGWGRKTSCDECPETYSFGGPKWGEVAAIGSRMAEDINNFLTHPCKQTYASLLLSTNQGIHTMHNGGYALTKWISGDILTGAGRTPGIGFVNPIAANIVLGKLTPETTPVMEIE